MSVRKRVWKNKATGEDGEAWIVDCADQHGQRHMKTFKLKKQADAWAVNMRVEVRDGRHMASQSVTVAEAGEHWIKSSRGNGL
jgi:integrase